MGERHPDGPGIAALHKGPALARVVSPLRRLSPDSEFMLLRTLPAFGDFTGLADVAPVRGDRVFVIADDQVVEVSAQGADTDGTEIDSPRY